MSNNGKASTLSDLFWLLIAIGFVAPFIGIAVTATVVTGIQGTLVLSGLRWLDTAFAWLAIFAICSATLARTLGSKNDLARTVFLPLAVAGLLLIGLGWVPIVTGDLQIVSPGHVEPSIAKASPLDHFDRVLAAMLPMAALLAAVGLPGLSSVTALFELATQLQIKWKSRKQ